MARAYLLARSGETQGNRTPETSRANTFLSNKLKEIGLGLTITPLR